ncbi:MAG: inositol monophosphatase family protein [Pirellulales bacterium]
MLREWAGKFAVKEKGPADLVTEADFASQEVVRTILLEAFPDHGFLGEENGASIAGTTGYRWIVDPLDGTTNYVHGLAQFCTSVALERDGKSVVGCIYDPSSDECFYAARGHGAFVNGRPLQVSSVRTIGRALVAMSFPPRVKRDDIYMLDLLNIIEQAQAVRRMGSSALNLCYVAAGRLDAYWARDTKAWDVAAGFLLVEEAGGKLTNLVGDATHLADPRFIAAATPELHAEVVELLSKSRS